MSELTSKMKDVHWLQWLYTKYNTKAFSFYDGVLSSDSFLTNTILWQEFQMKMESLQQRREELDRKEYQLKESLLKFDKFLKVQCI